MWVLPSWSSQSRLAQETLIHGTAHSMFTEGHKDGLRPRLPLRKYFSRKWEGMQRSLWRVLKKCFILIMLKGLEQCVGPDCWRSSKLVRRFSSERDSCDSDTHQCRMAELSCLHKRRTWGMVLRSIHLINIAHVQIELKRSVCVLRCAEKSTLLSPSYLGSCYTLWGFDYILEDSYHLNFSGFRASLGIMVGQRTLGRDNSDCTSASTVCNSPISPFPTKPVRVAEPWAEAQCAEKWHIQMFKLIGQRWVTRGSIWSRNWNWNLETILWIIHLKGLKFYWIYKGNRRSRRKKGKN